MNDTMTYNTKEIKHALITETLREVISILEEKGYNPINQIVGYLMSGDIGYISSYKDARKKLMKIEKTELLEVLVKEFVEE